MRKKGSTYTLVGTGLATAAVGVLAENTVDLAAKVGVLVSLDRADISGDWDGLSAGKDCEGCSKHASNETGARKEVHFD